MSSSSTLVILLAPPGPLGGIRDVLTDWSALGLVAPFLWLEQSAEAGAPDSARWVAAGRSRPAVLEQLLAVGRHRRIRLCVLVPALEGVAAVSAAAEDDVAGQVRASAGAADVERLRCTITRPQSGPGVGLPAREGWHNLVVSPEDAIGPHTGHRVLGRSSDPLDLGAPAAAVVSAVTGLWQGIDEAPLDGRYPLPGRTVRVVRAFYRRLDASATEQQVRAGVLSVSAELPRPRKGSARAEYIPNLELASSQLSETFWRRHAGVWSSGRERVPEREEQRIGALESLRMFGGFLLATLRNSPARWAQTLRHRYGRELAGRVQRGVFGEVGSRYAVVVNGVRGDGAPDLKALDQASSELGDAISRVGLARQPAPADLGAVWRDFTGAALTLADGGHRTDGLGPVEVDTKLGVARKADDVAPGRSASFAGPPGRSRHHDVPVDLRPYDAMGIERLQHQLMQPSDSGDLVERERLAAELASWQDQHRGALTVQVGTRLARTVLDHAAEVRHLLEVLQSTGPDEVSDSELGRKQERLAIALRVVFAVVLAVLAVLVVLGVRDTIETSTAVISGAVAVVVGAGTGFGIFVAQQRNLFAMLNQAQASASEAEVNERNLVHAAQDLRRTTQAYGQFLDWSAVLSVVIAQPYGDDGEAVAEVPLPAEGMPLSTAVGAAAAADGLLAETVRRLRHDHYQPGWLDLPWAAVLASAQDRLAGGEGSDLTRLYSEPSGPDYMLSRWAELIETTGTGDQPRATAWRQVLERLTPATLAAALATDVRTGDGSVRPQEFVAEIGVDEAGRLPAGRPERFALESFGVDARVSGRAAVAETWPRSFPLGGWGQVCCTVQLSEGLPHWDLSWAPDGGADDDPDEQGWVWTGPAL